MCARNSTESLNNYHRQALTYAFETRIKKVLRLQEAYYNRITRIKNFIVDVPVLHFTFALLFCRSQQSRKYGGFKV